MDIDGDELGGYLGSGGFVTTSDLAAAAAARSAAEDVAAGNSVVGMQVNRGGGFGQPDDANSSADMEAMVADRRRSLANGFGLDYLTMGDEDSYSAMVSSTYPPPRLQSGSASLGIPTTLEDVMDMNTSGPPLMNMLAYGQMSPPDMQHSMSMFSNRTGSITPRASISSPVDSIMTSVPSSPAVNVMHRQPQRSMSTASDVTMQGNSQSALDQSQFDQASRSIPGMYCSRGYNTYDNVTYGYPDMVPSSDQGLTIHPKQSQSQMQPAPSIFPENIYSSSGFDMLDILVTMTPTSGTFPCADCWNRTV
jgi:hypothetical protein